MVGKVTNEEETRKVFLVPHRAPQNFGAAVARPSRRPGLGRARLISRKTLGSTVRDPRLLRSGPSNFEAAAHRARTTAPPHHRSHHAGRLARAGSDRLGRMAGGPAGHLARMALRDSIVDFVQCLETIYHRSCCALQTGAGPHGKKACSQRCNAPRVFFGGRSLGRRREVGGASGCNPCVQGCIRCVQAVAERPSSKVHRGASAHPVGELRGVGGPRRLHPGRTPMTNTRGKCSVRVRAQERSANFRSGRHGSRMERTPILSCPEPLHSDWIPMTRKAVSSILSVCHHVSPHLGCARLDVGVGLSVLSSGSNRPDSLTTT